MLEAWRWIDQLKLLSQPMGLDIEENWNHVCENARA